MPPGGGIQPINRATPGRRVACPRRRSFQLAQPDRASGFLGSGSRLEAPALVTGLDDLAVVNKPVEQRGGHLRVAEDAGPFSEGEVSRHDERGALGELADQVE